MVKTPVHSSYVFDGFRLDGDKMLLYRGEMPTALPPKAVETLEVLVRRRGEIVGKEELIHAVWKGTAVEDSNLTQYLYLIRKTLGNRSDGRPYVETLRKRGYRFDAASYVREPIGGPLAAESEALAVPAARENIREFSPRPQIAEPAVSDRAARSPLKRFAALAAVQGLLVLAVLGVVAWFNSGAADATEKGGQVEFLRLTDGIEPIDAAISPDGKYFAYTEIDGQRSRVWIQQTGQTNRQEAVPWADKWIGPKTFSPDSQFIYFIEGDAAVDNMLYKVPVFGGPPVKILSGIWGAVSFSPDGRELVYFRHLRKEKQSQIVIRGADGTGSERVHFEWRDEFPGANVAWSPDGDAIAFNTLSLVDLGGNCGFYKVGLKDPEPVSISQEKWEGCGRIAWGPNGKGIYTIATKEGDGYSTRRDQVYFISLADGRSRRVTYEGSRHQGASLSVAENKSILVVPYNRVSQIWVMDPGGDASTAVQITKGLADGRAGIAPMADGRVAYIARNGENLGIWTMSASGLDHKQLTTEPQYMEELRSGGDGRFLFFSVPRGKHNDLFRINTDGTELMQVTHGPKVIDSGISHDGKWIVYGGDLKNGLKMEKDLWKVPMEGGPPIRLNVPGCDMPHFSPDDKLISCVEDQARVKILSPEGKVVRTMELLPRSTVNFGARWTPDGKAVVYIVAEKDVCNLWVHPIDGSPPRKLTNFTAGSIYHFAYSLDGKRLFVARGTQIRDAVLISAKAE